MSDHVVIGAGSAGCAMAYRLAEAGRSVTVVEHGGSDASVLIRMPGALSYPMGMARYDWGYRTEPEPGLGGRRLACPRGKVLGGSSSINGMVYVRGHPRDFDHWEEAGAHGWGWADVAPYFKRMEAWHGGASDWRGADGPVHVSRGSRTNPLVQAFVEAGRQAGYGVTDDYNGERQEGVGPMEATIHGGRRWSAADAYLRPAIRTGRVRVVQALARRVVFEDGRAAGVEVSRAGRVEVLPSAGDVIVCAGAINSPALLMRSGLGPAEHLREHGVEARADRPGVGANLQDHLEIYVQMRASQPISLYTHWSPWGRAKVGAQWLMFRSGPGASNQFESAGFVRSRPGVDYPDVQFHFLPLAVRYDGQAIAHEHGFQAHVGPMRSESRGRVRLASPLPEAPPSIRFDYLTAPGDAQEFRDCVRLAREIFAQPAFAPFVAGEIAPGEGVEDEALDAYVREHVESAYHPCGTCRMGDADDAGAVVDPEGRVIGAQGLRVADASVFPRITNGNLNAPSMMTGEKMADHLLGRRLARSNLVPWEHPAWATAQR